MRAIFLTIALAVVAAGQPTITLTAPVQVRIGAPVTMAVTLAGTSSSPTAALQLTIDGLALGPTAVITPTDVAKVVTCGGSDPLAVTCVVWGGKTPLVDGVIATITFPAPVAFTARLSGLLGVNAAGDSPDIAIVGGPVLVYVALSPCDINGDGKTDLLDVRNVVGQIDHVAGSVTDLNGDGKTDVVDLQRVVNATVDGVCRVGQ